MADGDLRGAKESFRLYANKAIILLRKGIASGDGASHTSLIETTEVVMEPIIDHYELNIAATVELSGRTFHWGRLAFPSGISLGQAQDRAHAIMATLTEEGLVFKYSLSAIHANTSHKVAI